MKQIIGTYSSPHAHWVGDGFPVRTLFSQQSLGSHLSPFLMLDHAGPAEFAPATRRRGVGEHPHRGFETVTIVYQGELEHRDSTGQGGRIGPGDVQWMTAASGILHEEFHSEAFTRTGGTLEMLQLWVNLRASDKMAAPGYQTIVSADIPSLPLPGGAGEMRVIAGEFRGARGPAHTFTPMDVWDMQLRKGADVDLDAPAGRIVALVVLRGDVRVNGSQAAQAGQMVLLDRAGTAFSVEATSDAMVLVLHGDAIDEPVASYGPFVMNTEEEIAQALQDFRSGRFGHIEAAHERRLQ
ncbi:pirin family protein [Cupriavidus sp. CV2]|uniref:pirin family protein n=1 Tax=Cupriavidus ulmosensis TaxID=3065913 RepID=UPI00296AAA1F|nr:pirin family protein [Cupriavidus sp. CV2]MDW3682651.1 pirin family protein [Cupriavidus sp. CV2]